MPHDTPQTIESVAVQAVARLVSLRHGPHVRLLRLTYHIEHPLGLLENIELSGFPPALCDVLGVVGDVTSAVPGNTPTDLDSPVETGLRAEILTLLSTADKPLKGLSIARKLGKDYDNSYFRRTLARLRSEGKLDHYAGRGYWLAGREVPTSVT